MWFFDYLFLRNMSDNIDIYMCISAWATLIGCLAAMTILILQFYLLYLDLKENNVDIKEKN